jgi:hypothetical protein
MIDTQERDKIRDRKMLRLRCRKIERGTDKTTKRYEIERQSHVDIKIEVKETGSYREPQKATETDNFSTFQNFYYLYFSKLFYKDRHIKM